MFNQIIKGLLPSVLLLVLTACGGTIDNNKPKTIPPISTDTTMPVITNDTNISIPENQAYIMKIKATDDAPRLTYNVSGKDAGVLVVNTITGDVSFKATNLPNFESNKTKYTFMLEANDGRNIASKEVTVNIINIVDETMPVFTSSNIFSIKENTQIPLKLEATDNSKLTYSISGGDSVSFILDSKSGIFSLKSPPDYEKKTSYNFKASVSDGTNTASQNVSVNIINIVDETMPVFTSPSFVAVKENQKSLMSLKATDNNILTYSLSGKDASAFDINASSGLVSFKIAPNYESNKTKYNIIALASDGTNQASQEINISILNVDETVPVFTSSNNISVLENSKIAFKLQATDDNPIMYSLSGTDASAFDVNASTGLVSFKIAPNYESNKTKYTITALASDGLNQASQDINISILNVAETKPALAQSLSLRVLEGVLAGSYLDTLGITAQNDSLISSFVLQGKGSENFSIDKNGRISLVKKLDYETQKLYIFDVYAQNQAGKSNVVKLRIDVLDENDLFIKAIVYDKNATGSVADDRLYIYFSKPIDANSISSIVSKNYLLQGNGAIGSGATATYNPIHRQYIINFDSTARALEYYLTTLSLVPNQIKELDGTMPLDMTKSKVLPYGALKRSEQKISYAPNDDGELQYGASPSYSRDNTTGIVLDHLTGLRWEDNASALPQTWATAKAYCTNLVLGTYTNWRMPTRKELSSLVTYGKAGTIDSTFKHTSQLNYWTSTVNADNTANVWAVNFTDGRAYRDAIKTDTANVVRCVHNRQ